MAQQEEQMYWKALKYARQSIYQDQTEHLLKTIESAQDKAKAVGLLTSEILGVVLRDAVNKGAEIDRPTAERLFMTLISDIAEFANAKGLIEFQTQKEVDRFVNESLLHASEQYAIQTKAAMQTQQQPPQQGQPPEGLLQQAG